jgi:hypothetical protein
MAGSGLLGKGATNMTQHHDATGEPQAYVARAMTIERAWVAFRIERGDDPRSTPRWSYAGTYDSEAEALKAAGLPVELTTEAMR